MAKKPKYKLTKAAEKKLEGDIPKGVTLDKLSTTYAHSYMSRFHDYNEAMEFLSEYVPDELKKKIQKMPKYSISQTAGWIAKYIKNGCTVMQESLDYLKSQIKMIEDYQIQEEPKIQRQITKTYENQNIIELDSIHDDIMMGNSVKFVASDFFKAKEVSVADIKAIKEYYSGCLEQLTNKENKEYFNHSPAIIKNLVVFYKDIELSSNIALNNIVRERKPRKAKAKPAAKLVSKLRFMKESPDLKITSISAERVVASEQLLIYNVKYKTLIMLFAKPGMKFGTHRTAITEIDEEKSFQKVLRKPEVNIHTFTTATKAGVGRHLKELKTTPKQITSFLTNDNLILLRAF